MGYADDDRRDGAETRLARTVRATLSTAAASSSPHVEHHHRTNWLRDVILGGQDGLVNILGIILGVIAGGGSKTVLLAAGFAAAITESISMGAVGYTSPVSQRDYFSAEPGTGGGHLQPVQTADIFRSAVVITVATLIGHLIPLLRSCGSVGRRR